MLDALVAAVQGTANYNPLDQEAPAAILWPDAARAWAPLLPRLRARLPLLTCAPYAPADRCGPPAWLRCMVARALPEAPPEDVIPVVYLPGVGARQLRRLDRAAPRLAGLTELVYRSVIFAQPNGTGWSPAAFFSSADGGLDIAMRDDAATRAALRRVCRHSSPICL